MARSFTDINMHQLDEEWLDHPQLVDQYARQLADAKLDLEEAKAELEVVTAELKSDIRADPDEFGAAKLTEAVVEEICVQQKAYQQAAKEVRKAKHAVDVLSGTMRTLDSRKRALENLVDLHGQNYFSQPMSRGSEDVLIGAKLSRARQKKKRKTQSEEDED